METGGFRRRISYGSPLADYNPLTRDYQERGIEACLAVNPLGSVDLRDASLTSPHRPIDQTNGSPSFWNDRWRSTDDERLGGSRVGYPNPETSPRGSRVAEEEDHEIAFHHPKKFGERNLNLKIYWSHRFSQAVIAFAAAHCFLLLLYRLVAVSFFVSGSYSLFWTVPYFFSITLASLSHSSIYLYDYIRTPVEVNTRFKALLSLMTLQNVSEWLKFSLGGSLMSWVFAAQLGNFYQGPILFTGDLNRPDRHTKFLNEESFYVIIGGAWFGTLIFFQRHFDFTRPRIKFPAVQKLKFLEFKAKARPTLQKSIKKGVWPAISYTILYHFFLWDIKNIVVSISLFLDSSTLEIDHTWYQFFNIRRFTVVYLSGVLTIFSFRMAKTLVRIFMLAPRDFGLELFGEDQEELSLSEAISDSRLPLVRALALKYLLNISRGVYPEARDRRRKIFSLNPLGDVPAEWNSVKSYCLCVIEQFTARMDGLKDFANAHRPKWSDDIAPVLPRQLAMQAMRLKVQREQLTEKRKAMSLLERLRFESKQFISRMPWLMYVFDNEKENSFTRLTRDCQEMLHSVRTLSCLASNSVVEDRFGVVQGDIPLILTTLSLLKDKLLSLRRVSPLCASYGVYVHRSLVRIWLSFPDSFGAEGLKHFR